MPSSAQNESFVGVNKKKEKLATSSNIKKKLDTTTNTPTTTPTNNNNSSSNSKLGEGSLMLFSFEMDSPTKNMKNGRRACRRQSFQNIFKVTDMTTGEISEQVGAPNFIEQ